MSEFVQVPRNVLDTLSAELHCLETKGIQLSTAADYAWQDLTEAMLAASEQEQRGAAALAQMVRASGKSAETEDTEGRRFESCPQSAPHQSAAAQGSVSEVETTTSRVAPASAADPPGVQELCRIFDEIRAPAAAPELPLECVIGCPPNQVCDYCQINGKPHSAPDELPEEVVRVPASTIEWLAGAAPHPVSGLWFERPAGAGAYWWRSVLREDIARLAYRCGEEGK